MKFSSKWQQICFNHTSSFDVVNWSQCNEKPNIIYFGKMKCNIVSMIPISPMIYDPHYVHQIKCQSPRHINCLVSNTYEKIKHVLFPSIRLHIRVHEVYGNNLSLIMVSEVETSEEQYLWSVLNQVLVAFRLSPVHIVWYTWMCCIRRGN